MSSRTTDRLWVLVGLSIMAGMFAIGLAANELTWGDMAIVGPFVLFAVVFAMTWNAMVRARRERQAPRAGGESGAAPPGQRQWEGVSGRPFTGPLWTGPRATRRTGT
jgi:hypothetical protein